MPVDRAALTALVRRIVEGAGTAGEQAAALEELLRTAPHPGASDLIFHSRPELAVDEIVAAILAYRPIVLPPPRPRDETEQDETEGSDGVAGA